LLANAVVATALGFVVYFRLIRTIGSMGTASVGYLKPGVGVLIGYAPMEECLGNKSLNHAVPVSALAHLQARPAPRR
jgi:hypothetical protein